MRRLVFILFALILLIALPSLVLASRDSTRADTTVFQASKKILPRATVVIGTPAAPTSVFTGGRIDSIYVKHIDITTMAGTPIDSSVIKNPGIAGDDLAPVLSGAKTWTGTQNFANATPMVVGGDTIYGGSSIRVFVVVDSAGNGDFTTVDGAINYCSATGRRKIYIRNGTYGKFTANLNDLVIEGESWRAIIDGTTIGTAITVSGATRVTIQSLAVRTTPGGGNGYDGITAGPDSLLIDRVLVIGSDREGFFVNGYGSTVRNCIIRNCDTNGILSDGTNGNMLIEGNIITSCAGDGIDISASTSNRIANNIVSSNTGNGILITNAAGSDDNIIIGNVSKSNGATGIIIGGSSCDNNVIVGNKANGNTTAQITDSGTGSTLAGNDTD